MMGLFMCHDVSQSTENLFQESFKFPSRKLCQAGCVWIWSVEANRACNQKTIPNHPDLSYNDDFYKY